MPNQPPLNPDALRYLGYIETAVSKAGYNCNCATTPDNVSIDKDWLDYHLRELRKALLAVAQPEVTDMDGLRALPADTILEASGKMLDGTFHQCMIRKLPDFVTGTDGTVDPGFECLSYTSSQIVTEVFFPARVLYRPEVNDA